MTTTLVSAPWATAADLTPDAVSPEPPATWTSVLLAASETLYLLSGQQWRGQGQSRVQVLPVDHGNAVAPGWVPLPVGPDRGWGSPTWRGRQLMVVKLPSSPVVSVDAVTVGGVAVDPSLYCCDRAGLLERTDGASWPVDGTLRVTFTHGIDPPQAGKDAAVALAVELAKVSGGTGGDATGRLRNIVTTLTREGVTVAAGTLKDSLDNGLTSLPEVDLFIKAVNPNRMTRRASAWTPDMGRARRVIA